MNRLACLFAFTLCAVGCGPAVHDGRDGGSLPGVDGGAPPDLISQPDPCTVDHGGCDGHATCTSTGPASILCACDSGYSGDGKSCAPIDSCATGHGGCDPYATCTDTGPGTNSCACTTGYSGDGKSCAPIDSCRSNNGGCDPNATCTSTGPGTNSCACDGGFSGDGKSCNDATLAFDADLILSGTLALGSAPVTGTLTLRNRGKTSMSGPLGPAAISGPSAALFSLVAATDAGACQPQQQLAPGGSCTLTLTVNPARAGILPASLVIGASPGGNVAARLRAIAVSGSKQILAAGGWHSCAVVNGAVQCWGENSSGQLGNGTKTAAYAPVAVANESSGVLGIAIGYATSCAITASGVQCWGENRSGELGNGTITTSAVPVPVSNLGAGVDAVACGDEQTCALVNGAMKCWGTSLKGELGTGWLSDQRLVPADVVGLSTGVTAISAGYYHTCAVVNGGAECWGYNQQGELGNGDFLDSGSPVAVSSLSAGVQTTAPGNDYTCAIANGAAYCWGQNSWGVLGNGTYKGSLVPLPVSGLSAGVTAIAVSHTFACALVNGGVQCWGDGPHGELASSSTSNVPGPANGLSTHVQVLTVGEGYGCALVDGDVLCWGDNHSGALGNGQADQNVNDHPIAVKPWAL